MVIFSKQQENVIFLDSISNFLINEVFHAGRLSLKVGGRKKAEYAFEYIVSRIIRELFELRGMVK